RDVHRESFGRHVLRRQPGPVADAVPAADRAAAADDEDPLVPFHHLLQIDRLVGHGFSPPVQASSALPAKLTSPDGTHADLPARGGAPGPAAGSRGARPAGGGAPGVAARGN